MRNREGDGGQPVFLPLAVPQCVLFACACECMRGLVEEDQSSCPWIRDIRCCVHARHCDVHRSGNLIPVRQKEWLSLRVAPVFKQFHASLHLLYYFGSLSLYKQYVALLLLVTLGTDFIVLLYDLVDLLLHLNYFPAELESSCSL